MHIYSIVHTCGPSPPPRHADITTRDRPAPLTANRSPAGGLTPEERLRLEAVCKDVDREIDRIVYELYGLVEEEIAVVEGLI